MDDGEERFDFGVVLFLSEDDEFDCGVEGNIRLRFLFLEVLVFEVLLVVRNLRIEVFNDFGYLNE